MERKQYIENNDLEEVLSGYLKEFSKMPAEEIRAEDAVGRITAEAVYAKYCDPVYNAAAMDGIAVCAAETAAADEKNPLRLIEGKDFDYVNTGQPVDGRYDAVIMIEDVLDIGGGQVEITAPAYSMQYVRVVGESVAAYEMLFPSGHRIRPADIGCILAAAGGTVKAAKRPKMGIIPTGSEMTENAVELKKGKLMESNTRVFAAMAEEFGADAERYAIVADDSAELERTVRDAVKNNDVVIINAGSSAGTKDYTVGVLSKLGKVYCHGLAIKPGKPTILAQVDGKPVIGVPGYPVSAYIVFLYVVKPLIERLTGEKSAAADCADAYLTRRINSTFKAKEFVRVSLGEVNGKLVATPLDKGAAAVMSFVKADGILEIPRLSEGAEAGETVRVELLKPLCEIKERLVFIGSHDMLIDVISDALPVSSAHVGSMGGISALLRGAAHIAPVHLLDEESGIYNIPFVKKYFAGRKMALIKCVLRTQGFVYKKGLEFDGIRGIADKRLRFANRQSGAGTRLLFDYELKKAGVSPEEIVGYEKEFTTHLAVAAAIEGGACDVGAAVYSAAKAFGLEFDRLADESYDFLLPYESLNDERIKELIKYLKSTDFKEKLAAIGGYDCARAGEIEVIDC